LVLGLYKQILREARQFHTYNYKVYTIRRTREEFKRNRGETNPEKIQALISKAKETRDMVARQATINSMYAHDDSILNYRPHKNTSTATCE
jgi:hypothetical protein